MASDPKIQESSGFESKPPGQKTSGGIGEMARPGTIISSSCGEDPHGEEENENIFLKMEPLESNEIEITLVNGGDAKPVFYKEPEHHNNDESDSREEEFDDIVIQMKPRRVEAMRVKIKIADGGRAKPKLFFDDILEDPATES